MTAIVIDTNVLLVADGRSGMISNCQVECVERLEKVRETEQVVLDYGRLILGEYHNKLEPNGRPTPGNAFLKWLLQTQGRSVSWVTITPTTGDNKKFEQFPADAKLEEAFDPDDRKFVAAANAHNPRTSILQGSDSKWLEWEKSLASHGIILEVLCRAELEGVRMRKSS
ncbi:MAG TPA: hypothetical protein VFD48_01735 [Pyrinomonadaceae bacterium]|nr:hypothetical protein [Pyrinomonadaceae bacterium]